MVSICGSTLVNIGTLSKGWIEAMVKAAKKADAIGKCWVLDPVGAGATPLRLNTCKELLKYHPTVIRGNASEIFALAGLANGSRGVDSTDSSSAAINAGKALAKEYHCVVGITGEVDYVTDGERVIESECANTIIMRSSQRSADVHANHRRWLLSHLHYLRLPRYRYCPDGSYRLCRCDQVD